MKIGINTAVNFKGLVGFDMDLKSTCKKLREIGYDCVDYAIGDYEEVNPYLIQDRKIWTEFFKEQARIINGEGLTVSQTHGAFPTDLDPNNPRVFTPEVLEIHKKEIEATNLLNSKHIVIHPIHVEDSKDVYVKTNVKAFSQLTPTLKEFGVKNCVENMWAKNSQTNQFYATGCSLPEDMLTIINELNDNDAFCACLDTGHLNILKIDVADAVKKLGDKLEVLHVHDNLDNADSHFPISFGSTDWEKFAKALKEVNYQGVFSLEFIFPRFRQFGKNAFIKYLEYAYETAKFVTDLVK